MGKYPVLLVAILILGHGVIARPQDRQSKQLSTTLASIVRNILDGTRDVVTAIYSAQAEAVTNFLTRTQSELTAASGFTSDVMDGTQHAADAITYISDDFFSSETSSRDGRKKKHPLPKLPPVPISFNKFFMNGIKSASGFADDKLKMLIQMSSNTGKLVSDTAKQISRVMEATEKFTKKVEKQRDKFENTVINEKLKLVETTKKSLSKFLKDLSKISRDANHHHDEGKARALLEAENELIDVTRESFRDILHETARAISRVSNGHSTRIPRKGSKKKKSKKKKNTSASSHHHQTSQKQDMISRMLSSASEKIKVFAKLTKDISKAIRKATKQKEKDVKKAQKKIRKQIKKAQKAKKRIKKKTRKDIKKIIKKKNHNHHHHHHDESLSTPGVFNATIDGVPAVNENGTEINSTVTNKPEEENPTSEEEEEEEDDYDEDDDEDAEDDEDEESDIEDDDDEVDDEDDEVADDEDYFEDEADEDRDEEDEVEDIAAENDDEEDARSVVKDDQKEIVEDKPKKE